MQCKKEAESQISLLEHCMKGIKENTGLIPDDFIYCMRYHLDLFEFIEHNDMNNTKNRKKVVESMKMLTDNFERT